MTDPWLLQAVLHALGDAARAWLVTPATDLERPWICVEPVGAELPPQGWKLHVSSYGSRAAETLERVLAPIIARKVAFKIIGSISWLGQINRGSAGLSQVGKFITIYPGNDREAADLASALADATRGLRGPEIPSDRPINGVLHYRYGGFGDLHMQTRLGDITPALVDPAGRLVPDRRGVVPQQPPWVEDPFAARGLGARSRLAQPIAERYQPVSTLSRSPGLLVQLALDVDRPRACVLKRARLREPGAASDLDPGSRLRREGALLARIADLGWTPRLYDVVDDGEELTLVTEDLGSETLEKFVSALATEGRLPPHKRVVEIAVALTDALAALHDRGCLHGDLKSANVVIGPDGRLRLIDLDLAQTIRSAHRSPGAGTRGYTSAGCRAGALPVPADDIYALGAVLYFLTTGAEPSRAPNAEDLQNRPPAAMNPAIHPALATIIDRCLCDDLQRGFASIRDVRRALVACSAEDESAGHDRPVAPLVSADEVLRQVRKAADHICAHAEPFEHGLVWRSRYYVGKGLFARDVNIGMAGTILALAELVDAFGQEDHIDVLRRGTNALAAFRPLPGEQPRGLYVGEAGIVAALLRAGQVLNDTGVIDAALTLSRSTSERPDESPDLFHGIAGRLLVHLLLWDETKNPEMLERSIRLGERLLDRKEGRPGEAQWRIPDGYADLSGNCYLGYAHGAAGIADTLLDLYEATGDRRFADAAGEAIAWIVRQAVPVLDDGSGLGWPVVENGPPHPPHWCHGATGIGRLLLHAARLRLLDGATDLIARTARSVANGARWSGPTLCHGLAGNIELLLDAAHWTGERRYRDDADRLMSLANAFLVESEHGCAWISEAPRQITPDYLVGYGGIALAYLRRARPDRRYQMSRAGFRYRNPQNAARSEACS